MKKRETDRINGQARQGDVLVIGGATIAGATNEVPRENGKVILAHGEVTGHAHAIKSEYASLYVETETVAAPDTMQAIGIGGGLIPDRLLIATEKVTLRHEEHGPIVLAPGKSVVRIQEEYHPAELRNVAD